MLKNKKKLFKRRKKIRIYHRKKVVNIMSWVEKRISLYKKNYPINDNEIAFTKEEILKKWEIALNRKGLPYSQDERKYWLHTHALVSSQLN